MYQSVAVRSACPEIIVLAKFIDRIAMAVAIRPPLQARV